MPGANLQPPGDHLAIAGVDAKIVSGTATRYGCGVLAEVDVKAGGEEAEPARRDHQLTALTQRCPLIEQAEAGAAPAAHVIEKHSGRHRRIAAAQVVHGDLKTLKRDGAHVTRPRSATQFDRLQLGVMVIEALDVHGPRFSAASSTSFTSRRATGINHRRGGRQGGDETHHVLRGRMS